MTLYLIICQISYIPGKLYSSSVGKHAEWNLNIHIKVTFFCFLNVGVMSEKKSMSSSSVWESNFALFPGCPLLDAFFDSESHSSQDWNSS